MRARHAGAMSGGKGRTPIMPHATGSTVPRVQDPSKSKVKEEGGAPGSPRQRERQQGSQAKTDMERAQEVADDNDGQTHPPIRVPLAQSQRLYLQEEVMLDVKKPPAEQLGVEDRRSAAEDAKRALTLFEENMDDKEADKLFFVQLPSALPIASMLIKEEAAPAQGDANDTEGPQMAPEEAGLHQQSEWSGKLGDVEAGYMGELRIHKSGKMYLQLGEITLQVSGGTHSPFRQEVLVVDKENSTCHALGAVQDRLICKLDPTSLLPRRENAV